MSQENVEMVRRGYEQFAATGRFVADIASPDFVWDMSNFHAWPDQQTYEGTAGVESFLDNWVSAWDDWELEVDALHDAGDKVVVLVRQRGRSKAAGTPVEMSPSRRSGRCATASRRAWTCTPTATRPSKPPGCRSRRCRKRTSRPSSAESRPTTAATPMRC